MTCGDNATAPTIIRLADIGIGPGDVVNLAEHGGFAQSTGWPENTDVIGAVFSRDNRVLDASQLHRVPGAIKAGPALITPQTANKGFFTDISEDFAVAPSGTKVVVPAGAQYLVVGAIDSYFADNYSTKGLSISINVLGQAAAKGRNAVQRLLPVSALVSSGATVIAPNGLVGGWVSRGGATQAAMFKGGSFSSANVLGGNMAVAYSIDSSGNLAGAAATPSGEVDAFEATQAGVKNLTNTAGSALAMNASGATVGYETIWGGFTYPFATLKGQTSLIDTSWNQGLATAINAGGDAVGYAIGPDWKPIAWVSYGTQSSRKAIALNLPSTVGAYPKAINDKGQIAGNYVSPNYWTDQPYRQSVRGFIYDKTGFRDLGTLAGGDTVEVSGINNLGEVVGSATTGDGETHGFVYTNGKMYDLGALDGSLSYATSINDAGQIVGTAVDGQGNAQAIGTTAIAQTNGVSGFQFSADYFPEGSSVTATITIGQPAPAAGLTVTLSSSVNGLVNFPAQVVVGPGQTTASFTVSANAANANTPFVLTGTALGKSTEVYATVRSLTLSGFRLSDYTPVANSTITGSFQLEAAALASGKTITLTTDNPAVTVTSSVFVPGGTENGAFKVKVGTVAVGTKVTVYAQCGDRQSHTTFTVAK